MGDAGPAQGPASPDRRKLLIALGFGATTAAALGQLGRPSSREALAISTGRGDDTSTGGTGGGSGTGSDGTGSGTGSTSEPPALADAAPEPEAGHVFDVVIAGGRVVDAETGYDATAHVGIDGDRITAISTTPLQGRRTLDAAGRVVTAGFVDILSYAPNDYGDWFKIADGVTTNLGMHGLEPDPETFFAAVDAFKSPLHHGGAYDHPFRRANLLGLGVDDAPSTADIDRLVEDCRELLEAGWIGVDFEPEYTPGTTYDEMKALSEVAAELGVGVYIHGRFSDATPPGTNAETIDEILRLARDTGAAVHVEHIISTGGTFTMAESLATIHAARAEGIDATACMYPYDFWATTLGSTRFADGWEERFRITYDDLEIPGSDERITAANFARLREDNILVAAHAIPEADVRTCLASPFVMLGSDAILEPPNNNHPRATGCFSRLLGRYVRDEGVLTLREALAKATILPAQRVGGASPSMRRKGRMQRGADADVVVFDLETVGDRSTIADPAQRSVGFDWVLVAGQVVQSPGGAQDTSVRPGRPVTRSN